MHENEIFPIGKRGKKTLKMAFTEFNEKFLLGLGKHNFFLTFAKTKKSRGKDTYVAKNAEKGQFRLGPN